MKINRYKTIVASLIGTLLFDIAGFTFTGQWESHAVSDRLSNEAASKDLGGSSVDS